MKEREKKFIGRELEKRKFDFVYKRYLSIYLSILQLAVQLIHQLTGNSQVQLDP